MNTATYELIAANSTVNAVAAFVGGLFIAGALVWAVLLGIRVRSKELPPPLPEEQPRLPDTGAVHEEREVREPDEVPLAADESERLMPYNLHAAGSRHADDQHRKRWVPGSSGSFGSGGPGRT
ncbi:hypothetical protein GCM10011579_083110 [Streptomyces albiflavescens]|uniref:Secreted protein n=1 Tax=Streptomyces albiflavescens TaxID=1623582 RepID=A0A917YDB7_9ACTN|nr:DUF6479 family protein [Streptomyces albiflavescens]GGN88918.1 hypothetical protein GCM10011579_083110 [Streptomyces albiflavescens]